MKAIFGSTIIIALGQVSYGLAQWGLITFLIQSHGLSVAGEYALALAIITPVILFFNFSLREVLSTDVANKRSFTEFFNLRLISIVVTLVLISSLFLVLSLSKIAYLVLLTKAVEAISDLYCGAMQRAKRASAVGMSALLRSLFGALCFYGAYKVSGGVVGGFLGLIVSWAAVILFFDVKNSLVTNSSRLLRPKPSYLADYRVIIQETAPLFISLSLTSLVFNIPRYALSSEELGLFTAIISFALFANLVCIAIGQAIINPLSRAFESANVAGFLKLVVFGQAIATLLAIGLAALALIAGEWLLYLIYGASVSQYADLFLPLMIIAAPLYWAQVFNYVAISVHAYKFHTATTILSGVVSAIIAMLLTPHLGVLGAGIAMGTAGVVQMFGYAIGVYYKFKVRGQSVRI